MRCRCNSLSRGIDVDPKYYVYIDCNEPSFMIEIVSGCHWHLLKYINMDRFIEEALSIQLCAFYKGNIELLKAVTEGDYDKFQVPEPLRHIKVNRAQLLSWFGNNVECYKYLCITREEIDFCSDLSILIENRNFNVISEYYTREEIQEWVNSYKYYIYDETLIWLSENGYDISSTRYEFECNNQYFELARKYININYKGILVTILTSTTYEPYMLRLIISKLNRDFIKNYVVRVRDYIRDDPRMNSWFDNYLK